MKHFNSILALSAGLLFAATACVNVTEINDRYRPAGTPIVFSAASGYDNGVETRAEYSGAHYGSSPAYERIDWKAADPITIVYNGTASNYTVATVSGTTSEMSDATLSSGNLLWTASGPHTFYALYPAGATGSNGSLTSAGVVSGTIPRVQDVTSKTLSVTEGGVTYSKYQPDTEHYGYMAAYKQIANQSTETTVVLPFRPAFTTFEFKFKKIPGDEYTNKNIKSFTLSTETVGSSRSMLNGTFSFSISGMYQNPSGTERGAAWNPAQVTTGAVTGVDPYSITVGFGSAGVAIPEPGYLDFSILALPVDITGATMTITYSDNTSKSLKLRTNNTPGSETWYTFTGAKKYVISNTIPGNEIWHYVIEEIEDQIFSGHTAVNSIPYTVKSYKYSDRDPNTKVPVAWKTQYSLDDGTTWTDVAAPNTAITNSDYTVSSAITGSGVDNSTYSAGEGRTARLNGDSTPSGDTEHSPATIIADLASRDAKGDTSNPWDLSMHDIYGNSHSQTTANSYIVTAPGTYKFPVVYGNAITNGNTNYTEAYWPANNSSQISSVYFDHSSINTFRYIARFIRADGNFMSQARIDLDMNPASPDAAIVWQNRMELTPGEGPGPIVQESSVSYSNGYITFTVDPADIRPGNVVIAFRGTVSGLPANSILWSWQIWICPDDLTPVQFSNGALLPYNLGYIDSTGAGIQNYPNRLIQFRIVQVENGVQHETEDFLIEQVGDGRAWDASVGFNVYYQWGRKDPMIPAKDYGYTTLTPPSPATGERDVYPDADIYPGTGYTINVHGTEIAGGVSGHNGVASPVYVPIQGYTPGITQPYVAFINTVSTGWVGGYINGDVNGATTYLDPIYRQFSSIACNLWNNGVYTTMDGTNAMWKTVYDPCPPGFCVPTAGVLGNLTADNLVARTSDGAYFSTPNGTRLFMPYSGLRVYYADAVAGNYLLWAEEVRRSGWYWTDTNNAGVNTTTINLPTSAQYARSFSFGRTNINPILPVSSSQLYTRGSSLAIRPMVDPKYSAN